MAAANALCGVHIPGCSLRACLQTLTSEEELVVTVSASEAEVRVAVLAGRARILAVQTLAKVIVIDRSLAGLALAHASFVLKERCWRERVTSEAVGG